MSEVVRTSDGTVSCTSEVSVGLQEHCLCGVHHACVHACVGGRAGACALWQEVSSPSRAPCHTHNCQPWCLCCGLWPS